MAKFFDALSGETREMGDWLDRTGSKARGRAARQETQSTPQKGNQNSRPGLGTAYTVGSHRSYNAKSSTPSKVVSILDIGNNLDLLSPGNID